MSTEEAKRRAHDVLQNLSAALAAGHGEAFSNYLAAVARFQRYSATNTLLITAQRPDATRVAGFHEWRKLGRTVVRGTKGIAILAPIVRQRASSEDDEEHIAGFRPVHVFDIAQTSGRPLPELGSVQGTPRFATTRLKAVIATRGITLEHSQNIAPAHGCSSGRRITLLPGLPPGEEFATLAHELLHPERRQETTRRIRETEAEAVAFVVCQAVGLETNTASRDYINLYGGDAETLAASLNAIQKAAALIIREIQPALAPSNYPQPLRCNSPSSDGPCNGYGASHA